MGDLLVWIESCRWQENVLVHDERQGYRNVHNEELF